MESLKKFYEIDLDIKGSKNCGITLEWDYVNRTVDLSMPTYVPTKLKEFNHPMPKKPQHQPYPSAPMFSRSQKPVQEDDFAKTTARKDKAYTTNSRIFHFLRTGDRPHNNVGS